MRVNMWDIAAGVLVGNLATALVVWLLMGVIGTL